MTRDEIKKELERLNTLAEQRTPGEWEAGIHPANSKINIVRPVMFAKYTGKLPDCEGGAVFFRNKADAELLAAVPALLAICNALAAIPLEATPARQACSVVDERRVIERMQAAYESVLPRVGADLPVFYDAMQAAYRAAQSEAKPELRGSLPPEVLYKAASVYMKSKDGRALENAILAAIEALSLNGKKG